MATKFNTYKGEFLDRLILQEGVYRVSKPQGGYYETNFTEDEYFLIQNATSKDNKELTQALTDLHEFQDHPSVLEEKLKRIKIVAKATAMVDQNTHKLLLAWKAISRLKSGSGFEDNGG